MTSATLGALVAAAGLLARVDLADDSHALVPTYRTVRVLLEEGVAPLGGPLTGGGRLHQDTPAAPDPRIRAQETVHLQVDPQEEALVPLTPPKPLPERPQEWLPLKPELLSPTPLPGQGGGLGSGSGAGVGGGSGSRLASRKGATWIHTARGDEELKVDTSFLDFKNYVIPDYPDDARCWHISGDVVLEVTIDPNGKPLSWKVVEGHPLLVEAVQKVFPRWHFIPPVYNGEKVGATFEVRVRFSLL